MNNLQNKITQLELLEATVKTVKNWFPCLLFHTGVIKKQTFIIYLRNNKRVKIRKKSGDMIAILEDFYDGQYPLEGNKLKIDNRGTILDIGAHIGTFILAMKSKYPNVKILAFEPDNSSYKLCQENIKINKLKEVKVEKLALWKEERIMTLHMAGNDYLGASIVAANGDSEEKVQCTTMEKIFQKYSITSCDLLKIDVEGAEYEVLYNAPERIFKKTKAIFVEFHTSIVNPRNKNGKNLAKFLKIKGYKVDKHASLPILFAYK